MTTTSQRNLQTRAVIVPLTDGEPVMRHPEREGSILLAREEITITHARFSGGQHVAGPHIHHEHTDAFYVLEGELTFEIGREANTIIVGAGGFVAAPPHVAHSFGNHSERPARWLTIHARDGGFAAFVRGARDGVDVEWDISPVPADGGLPASAAIVSPNPAVAHPEAENQTARVRCSLPDLRVSEQRLQGPHHLPLWPHDQDSQIDTFLVLDGAVEATLAGRTHTVGPRTLVSVPRGVRRILRQRDSQPAHVLSLHTPNGGPADDLRPHSRGRGLERPQ